MEENKEKIINDALALIAAHEKKCTENMDNVFMFFYGWGCINCNFCV